MKFLGGISNIAKAEDKSKQVEVCLHPEVKNINTQNGDIKSCANDSPSVNAIDDSNTKVLKDKKHKTTNVPSNCSTAILMPLNGVKRISKQKGVIDMKSIDTIKDNVEAPAITIKAISLEKNCDR